MNHTFLRLYFGTILEQVYRLLFSGSHVEDIKLYLKIVLHFQFIMKAFIRNRNIVIFFLIITTTSVFVSAKLEQDVSCSVTSHYADGQTISNDIKCQKNSGLNKKNFPCCAISNELGLSSEWGPGCGARDEHLFNVINVASFSEPTATTCALRIVFKGKEGKKKI